MIIYIIIGLFLKPFAKVQLNTQSCRPLDITRFPAHSHFHERF